MNNRDLGEPSSRISQIRKQSIEDMISLTKHSIYNVNTYENDLAEIAKLLTKIDLEDPRLTKREPPTIAPLKIKSPVKPINYAQVKVDVLKRLKELSYEVIVICGVDRRALVLVNCEAIGNTKIKIRGYENEVEVVLTVPYDEIDIIVGDRQITGEE